MLPKAGGDCNPPFFVTELLITKTAPRERVVRTRGAVSRGNGSSGISHREKIFFKKHVYRKTGIDKITKVWYNTIHEKRTETKDAEDDNLHQTGSIRQGSALG